MAVTFTITDAAGTAVPPNPQVMGTLKCRIVDIAFAGTYTTAGDSLPAARFGLDKIVNFTCEVVAAVAGTTANLARYDHVTSKLQLFEAAASGAAFIEKTGAEAVVANSTMRAMVYGY